MHPDTELILQRLDRMDDKWEVKLTDLSKDLTENKVKIAVLEEKSDKHSFWGKTNAAIGSSIAIIASALMHLHGKK